MNIKEQYSHFELTFEQFKAFAIATDYYKRKGRKATCYHIDRINVVIVFSSTLLMQLLTNRDNVKKYAQYNFYYDPVTGFKEHNISIITERQEDIDDVPF